MAPDLVTDIALALVGFYDREPVCTCTSTDRGTDTLGCEAHDDADQRDAFTEWGEP